MEVATSTVLSKTSKTTVRRAIATTAIGETSATTSRATGPCAVVCQPIATKRLIGPVSLVGTLVRASRQKGREERRPLRLAPSASPIAKLIAPTENGRGLAMRLAVVITNATAGSPNLGRHRHISSPFEVINNRQNA